MNRRPIVSGIIIFLDAEAFIEEAIASVLAQTYDRWELLLVDDGSTDESSQIAKRYVQQYPDRIRYLEHDAHQNQGMSASRNLGIAHSRGKYIAFLDADDLWLPNKLAQQVALLETQPEAAMLYGRTQYWHSWTGDPADAYKDCLTKQGTPPNQLIAPPTLLTLYLEDGQIYPCTCSILVRRETFENIGMFEPGFRNANEDMVFYAKVFLQAPVFVANECWDLYRMNPDSYWSNYWSSQSEENSAQTAFHYPNQPHPERHRYLQWLASYMQQQGIEDRRVWQALQKALWPYQHSTLQRFVVAPYQFFKWQLKTSIWRISQRAMPPWLRQRLTQPLLEIKE